MLPIQCFLSIAEPLDQFRGDLFTEPLPENGVVALPEGGLKLFVRDGETFPEHRVSPCLPVVFGRVDNGSIHVPEYGALLCHLKFHSDPLRILAVRVRGNSVVNYPGPRSLKVPPRVRLRSDSW